MNDTLKKFYEILDSRERREVKVVLAAILLMAFGEVFGAGAIFGFMSVVADPQKVQATPWINVIYNYMHLESVNHFLIVCGVILLVVLVGKNVVSAFATFLQFKFVWGCNHSLSMRLTEQYLKSPYLYFLQQNTSKLQQMVLVEVNQLVASFLLPGIVMLSECVVVFAMSALLVWYNPLLALITFSVLGATYTLIYSRFRKILNRIGVKRLSANESRFKVMNHIFGGIKELKVFGRESFFLNEFSKQSQIYTECSAQNELMGNQPKFLIETIAFGGVVLVTLSALIAGGNMVAIIPAITLYVVAGYRMMPSMNKIMFGMTRVRFNKPILDRVHEDILSNKVVEYSSVNESSTIKTFARDIAINNLFYTYPGRDEAVLKGISLKIKKNTSIAFVGETGAGKSTLVDIILGLHIPESGSFAVDGQVVTSNNVRTWQQQIGYVPQQIFLADDTITNNIAFGIPKDEIDHSAVLRAARIAHLEQFVTTELPQGFETIVGERGVRLSGGQRQRIGIARALYRNPAVLVMDEATSAVDGLTEKQINEAIDSLVGAVTLIVIAHRLSTVRRCDMIYLLSHGSVVAQGNYDELLNSNAQFKGMAQQAHVA